jgi:HEAT repeat protein
MKKLLCAAAFLAAGSLGLQNVSFAHGGTYKGPGDTVPPGGGGGGGGGGPATPGPAGPGAPGAGGPSTPGAVTPGAPAAGPSAARPKTGGGGGGEQDLTLWQFWWGFNNQPYLNLKSHIHSGAVVTGSEEFYLGKGDQGQARDTLRPSEEAIRLKIVPALVKALQNERSNDILTSAMVGLAKIGDAKGESGKSQMAEYIKPFLANGNQEVAETAAVSLGILANPENIDLLVSMVLNDSAKFRALVPQMTGEISDRSRAFAAYGLGLIGATANDDERKRIVAACVKLLEGEGKKLGTRDIQVGCITSIGLSPLPIDPNDAGAAGAKPTTLNSRQDQLRWLLSYFSDEQGVNYLLRAHAPTAMGRLLADVPAGFGMRDIIATALMEPLGEHSKAQDAIQQSCALALGQIGDCDEDPIDKKIRTALMEVKDKVTDQQTRNFALISIAQAAGRPGSGAGDTIFAVNTTNKKENVRSYLLDQLAKGKNAVRPWSGIAIGVMERSLDDHKQPSSADTKLAIRSALGEAKSPEDIGAFSIATGIVKDQGAKDILLKNLDGVRDIEARGYTAVALGLMDVRDSVAPIQEIVRKSKYQPDLLKSAAIGLGLLGDKQLVPDLIEMLKTSQGLSAQAAISSALGFIGDSRSIDPLVAMLENKEITDLARAFAAVALGIVADKEDLPWNSKVSVNINYRANTTTLTDGKAGILDIL